MKSSATLEKISPCLVKALSELKGALKDSKNPHFKNDYASLESVIDTVRPVLANHDLGVIQGPGEMNANALTVTTRIIHASGEWIESDFQIPLAKADPQAAGSAVTYARRYALMGMLGIPALDDDAESAMHRGPAQTAASSRPPSPTLRERADRLMKTMRDVKDVPQLKKAFALGSGLCAELDAKDPELLAEVQKAYDECEAALTPRAAA